MSLGDTKRHSPRMPGAGNFLPKLSHAPARQRREAEAARMESHLAGSEFAAGSGLVT